MPCSAKKATEFSNRYLVLLIVGILDMGNEKQVYLLHYVFIPRINQVIESFTVGWNNHPIRTEKNWCQNKLWTNGMLDPDNNELVQVNELHNAGHSNIDFLEWYGMDWNSPSPFDDGLSTVEVDDVCCPFNDGVIEQLEQFDTLKDSASFGIDIYLEMFSLLEGNM